MCQLLRIIPGILPASLHSNCFETSRLGRQTSASPDGTDFNTGHRARDPQIALGSLFHESDAIRTLNILRGILTSSQEHRRDIVRRMSIKASHSPRHRTPNQVLVHVRFRNGPHGRFQGRSHNVLRNRSFDDNALSPTLDPVHGGGLLVRAHVAAQCQEGESREDLSESVDDGEAAFANHVHSHGVAGEAAEANVHVLTSDGGRGVE
mmetsp:Transcript_23118/g.37507  ORF Transcript_23118/g.37507 Transcript_23118/m.37507 type:complete len:207 (+) Transcript_23118:252-872(+)